MQSRFDHLIHTQFHQLGRRPALGVALTTAAIVAVVLCLAAPANTHAAQPAEEADGAAVCEGIGGAMLSVIDRAVSDVSHSSDNACHVSITITPPTQGVSNCQVSYTPVVSDEDVSVAFATTGSCDGVVLESSIGVDPSSDGVLAQSRSRKAVRSKVTGKHFGAHGGASITMFWHYAKVIWEYDLNRVYNGSLSTDYWQGGCGWELTSESTRVVEGRTRYLGEHNTKWYTDCGPLPDARANSTASVTARPGGAYSCYGRATFTGGLPGFNYKHECLVH